MAFSFASLLSIIIIYMSRGLIIPTSPLPFQNSSSPMFQDPIDKSHLNLKICPWESHNQYWVKWTQNNPSISLRVDWVPGIKLHVRCPLKTLCKTLICLFMINVGSSFINLFKSMTMLCVIDNIIWNVLMHFRDLDWVWEIYRNILWNIVSPTKQCYGSN
jgi:hypothetical protein